MNWESFERIGLIATLIGFAVLGWFGWKLFTQNAEVLSRITTVEARLDSIIKTRSPVTESGCGRECVRDLVSQAVATISGIAAPVKQEVVERVVEKVQTVSTGPKTQYITLGGGDTSQTSWTDIPGAEVTFDIADLGQIKQIFFEVSLFSQSGKVLARLWDKRAGTIVAGSETEHIAGDAVVKSSPVTIPAAGRTIFLQLKSEVGQPVKANTSRLRVDTK